MINMDRPSTSPAKQEKSDGIVVQVYDSKVKRWSNHRSSSGAQCVFIEPDKMVKHPMKLNLLSRAQCLHRLQQLNAPQPILRDQQDLLKQSLKGLSRRVADVLLHGKIRLVLLLNTSGGSHKHNEDVVQPSKEFVEAHGGSFHTFGTTEAASAGFELFLLAEKDRRAALQTTEFLHHIGHPNTEEEMIEFDLKRLRVDYRRTMSKLLREASRKAKPTLREKFEKAKTESDNWEVNFTGNELHDMGVLHTACADISALVRKFIRSTGIFPDYEVRKTDPIARFFYFSALEQIVRREHGSNVRIKGYPLTIEWGGDVSKKQQQKGIALLSPQTQKAVLSGLAGINEEEKLLRVIFFDE
jgi:ATP-dependent protease ClpP protease subunit